MRSVDIVKVDIATDGDGDWTATFRTPRGALLQYRYVYGDMDTGADLDVVGATTGYVYVNQDNLGTSSFTKAPRQPTHDNTGAASLYAGSGEPVEDLMYIGDEQLTFTIASGGASKTGTLYLWVG